MGEEAGGMSSVIGCNSFEAGMNIVPAYLHLPTSLAARQGWRRNDFQIMGQE